MLLYFGNPDHCTTASVQTRHFHRLIHFNVGAMGSLEVRSDGYGGRPGLTSSGGHIGVEISPRWPGIHPVANYHRSGGRFLFESFPSSPEPILAAINPGAEICACAALNPDGTLSIYRGNPNTTGVEIRQSNTVLDPDTFYRIGFACHPRKNSQEGYIQLNRTKIVQAPIGSDLEGVENQNWSGTVWNILEDSAVSHYYTGDSYGHQPDLIPDLLVKFTRPAATTDVDEWVSNLADKVAAISDTDADDDDGYLASQAANSAFLQALGALDPTEIIHAAQLSAMVRNVEDYGPAFRHLLSVNGIIREGDVDFPLEMFYQIMRHMYYQAPGNPLGWSYAEALATDVGGRQVG